MFQEFDDSEATVRDEPRQSQEKTVEEEGKEPAIRDEQKQSQEKMVKASTGPGFTTLPKHGRGDYTPLVETDRVRSDTTEGLSIVGSAKANDELSVSHPLNKEPVNWKLSDGLTQSGHHAWPPGASRAPATVQGDEHGVVILKSEQSVSSVSGAMGVRIDELHPGETLPEDDGDPPDICFSDDEEEEPVPERCRRNLRAAALQMNPEIEDIIKAMLEEDPDIKEERECEEWWQKQRDERPVTWTNDPVLPCQAPSASDNVDDTLVAPMDLAVNEDHAILATEEEIEIEVAADTGCVAHVAGPDSIPNSVAVERPADGSEPRNFIGAGGDTIKNYRKACVGLVQKDGKEISNVFHVADVCRPLHSVSTICDNGHEMLFTRGVGVVVPEGALSRFLANVKQVANYPRKGGLYVSKMKAKKPKSPVNTTDQSFGRPGARSPRRNRL